MATGVVEKDNDDNVLSASLCVVLAPSANTGGTLTLPAPGANKFHYITAISIVRGATAALVGSATLSITSTNLNGFALRVGNAMIVGGTQSDFSVPFYPPLKSQVANTATTLVFPAPGAAVLWNVVVTYYVAS